MDTINHFTDKANLYTKYRPSYPKECIDDLLSKSHATGNCLVADIGSGTGIFSHLLLARGLKVMAVEPNADMRKEAEQSLSQFEGFHSVGGKAENTKLGDGSIDLVTVAQAFHWFDKEKFKQECKRILKPAHKVALVWNSRDLSNEIIKENEEICRRLCPDFSGFSGGIAGTPGVFAQFFKDGKYEFQSYPNHFELDYQGFLGRNLSASYSPKKDDKQFVPFVEALSDLFVKYNHNGIILYPNTTITYLGNV